MKKIAIISTSYFPNIWNGHGRSTFATAYGLARKGYDVSVFTFTDKPESYKQQDGQVAVQYIASPPAVSSTDLGEDLKKITSLPFDAIPKWNKDILICLNKQNPDIIVLNNWQGWEAANAYRNVYGKTKIISQVPFLYSFSGWLKPLEGTQEQDIKNIEADFLNNSDTLIAHSLKFGQKLATYTNREINIIPNCYLDLSSLNGVVTAKTKIRNQICFIGKVNREKCLERIIRVMPELPQAQLVVVSPENTPSYFSSLITLAKTQDVDHRIKFLGWMPTKDVREIYKESSLAIVPSQFEPYGYAALDPMALGTPVIVSEWSHLNEYIDSDEMVFSNLKTLQDKISYCLSLGSVEQAAKIVTNRFRINTILSEDYITNLLDTVVGG